MPSDDLVLNVRQVAGYSPTGNAPPSSSLLLQLGGLGGPYASISPAALVSTALSNGGDMAIAGALAVQSVSGGSAQFSNAAINMFSAQKACIVDLAATWGTVGGVQIATINDISALGAAQKAATVWSFNGRTGDVRLWIDDIRCAGGAPIFSPRFEGSPRACTPPPESNSTRLATTAFVQNALAVDFTGFAPIESPNFTGIPSAPTAAVGSSDGQLATTAFVQNAVSESTTGVSSFNTRTGAVLLTAADVTSVGGALVASPSFTGVPTAVTATPGTSSTQLATCAFVAAAVAAVTAGVSSFNSRTGAVVLTAADVAAVAVSTFNGRSGAIFLLANDISAAGGALLAGPAFSGAPSAPTAALGTSTTQLATCAFVQEAVTAVTAGVTSWNGRSGAVTLQSADIAAVGGALLASPAFTGAPSAPTAAPGVSSTQLATTAFVAAAVSAGTAGVASFNSRTGSVTLLVADISAVGGALLASPNFTGVPTAPTALPSVSTTQIATTAFVSSVLPSAYTAAPLMNGTASAGSSAAWSRGDHVHPSDTSKLSLTGGALTGALAATTINASGNVNAASLSLGGATPSAGCLVLPAGLTNGVQYNGAPSGQAIAFQWTNPIFNAFFGGALIGGLVWSAQGPNTAIFNLELSGGTSQMVAGYTGGTAVWSITLSDRRLKDHIADPDKDALALLNALPVHQFEFNSPFPGAQPQHWDFGLIADEVETVLPTGFVAALDDHSYQSIRELPLIAALVKAVQQLTARIGALETRIAT